MKKAVLVCLGIALLLTAPAAAAPDVSLEVDDEAVDDGDTVETGAVADVRVLADSDGNLTRVETESSGGFSIENVNRASYNQTRSVTVSGTTEFTATATDDDGETSVSVTLTRPTETAADAQRAIDSLESEIESVNDEIDDLRDRRDELEDENEDLIEQASDDDTGTGDPAEPGEGLPGFTALVALAAVLGAVLTRRRTA